MHRFYDSNVMIGADRNEYLQLSVGRVIVYDVTDRVSFESMKQLVRVNQIDFEDQLKKEVFCRKFFIVGETSKSDNFDRKGINRKQQIEREISFDEASEFTKTFGITYTEVNVETGFNLTQLADMIVNT